MYVVNVDKLLSEDIWQFPPISVRRLLQILIDFIFETKPCCWDISLVLISLKMPSLLVILDAVKQGYMYSVYLIKCMDNTGSHLVIMCRDDGWLHNWPFENGGNGLTSIAHYNCKL